MLIDYDKDPASKRAKQYERQRLKEYREDSEIVRVMCNTCGQLVLKLRIPPPKTFATLVPPTLLLRCACIVSVVLTLVW
jgi:hypothetical protein